MATSDSDDFESADEEIVPQLTHVNPQKTTNPKKCTNTCFDSDSDNDYCPSDMKSDSWSSEISTGSTETAVLRGKNLLQEIEEVKSNQLEARSGDNEFKKSDLSLNEGEKEKAVDDRMKSRRQRPERQRKEKVVKSSGLGAKKLGAKLVGEEVHPIPEDVSTPEEIRRKAAEAGKEVPIIQECWEIDDEEASKILQKENQNWSKEDELDEVPEELRSNKSFKEVFSADGWESFGDEEKILKELEEEKEDVKPVLEKMVEKNEGWGGWGGWGVSSLLSTASVGVSTLTSHVSQGLSLLEESMGVPDPEELVGESGETPKEEKPLSPEDPSNQSSAFGLGSWMSGMSSITKLVETTGTKVITGGLGTLETIGKKTMEVLQEGDPGLKKKRAFFLNEGEKPILSQMLREAKEKAEVEEKSVEDKELARKVHFETLFDDFQGLVHLEALEMLSKQSNIKIQQKMVALEPDDMLSAQETLQEVKELCDLGEEDDEDADDVDLKEKLKAACPDLGVNINYDKLNEIWEETKAYVADISKPESSTSEREIFQNAISSLAKFTAYSVERFHKTAELLLVKERRSTVNEADALVQLTQILSGQIATTASVFSKCLNDKSEGKSKDTNDITTIFLEATNASSYIQDAFRLLIPILQVGAV